MASEEAAARLKALIKQRSTIKSQVTRILTFVKQTAEAEFCDLESRREKLEQLCNSYEEIQGSIEQIDDDRDYNNERAQFEQQYFEAKSLLSKGMRNLQAPVSVQSPIRVLDSPNTVMVKQSNLLLPKIEIRPFDGNPIDWHSFHDTFKSLVHDNDELPAVQKFYLLKNSLRGDVSTLIASLTSSEENYKVAWDLLQQRCNKPRQIKHAHLRLLFDLPEIKRDTPSNLRALAEKAQMHVNALKLLREPVEQWDKILVYLLINKLDKNTRRSWERTLENEDKPKFTQLISFINKQARSDEIESENINPPREPYYNTRVKARVQVRGQVYLSTGNQLKCILCKQDHELYHCQQFLRLNVQERFNTAKGAKVCLNCLRTNHNTINCKSGGCRKCYRKHHSFLHFNNGPREITVQVENTGSSLSGNSAPTPSTSKAAYTVLFDSEVLLGTAQVKIVDRVNQEHNCRALLDGGSQAHFITERLADKLKIPKCEINLTFSGLNGLNTRAQYYVTALIKARDNSFTEEVRLIVLPLISGLLPSRKIDSSILDIPKQINLADPGFHEPGGIDLLFGNTLFYRLLCIGQIRLCNKNIILQKTRLGWLVTGEMNTQRASKEQTIKSNYLVTSLDKQLERFWELEELPNKQLLSPQEIECERHFTENTYRDSNGCYIVRLPFNEKKGLLGESRGIALRRFYALERKLHQNPSLVAQYVEFLKEYETLGHMSEVEELADDKEGFYLPHHAVVKESSLTTKVRVVFDASAKSSSGVSLNDTLMVGPAMQDTLFAILLRFRSHAYVITADVEKMFRQVKIHPEDKTYQRILWRDTRDKPVKSYTLNTVTYGTASAPYLAVRCLKQLADDEGRRFPLASQALRTDFYMDDLLTGASNLERALNLRNEVIALTQAGGFHLRQWTSNNSKLIEDLNTDNHLKSLSLDSSEPKKTLGIFWDPFKDTILYTIKPFPGKQRRTKRVMLSEISQLFGPLGLLGPVVIKAKTIIQQLWKANIGWDENVPHDIHRSWIELKDNLPLLSNFVAPRKIIIDNAIRVEMHGFCDSSEIAYGACIYIRSTDKYHKHEVNLLCAKSRVAPVKTLSLPRLELCAARLLAKLFQEIIDTMKNIQFDKVTFWSDSTIVLHWISTPSHLLKTFVANRVSEIQSLTDPHNWLHVSSIDNPADFISRGQSPSQFVQNSMWLKGPQWLSQEPNLWPSGHFTPIEIPEKRKITVLVVNEVANELLTRFSPIKVLNRVVARLLCVANYKRNKEQLSKELAVNEIKNAHLRVIKLLQLETFPLEIKDLKQGGVVNKRSKLLNLNPFIDESGILRVGGRLKHAPLSYSQKHPILLPHNHHITNLIIREEHLRHWHAGVQATLNAIRQNYWPVDGKNVTRRVIRQCIRCCKFKPTIPNYIMGNLPSNRIRQTRPFQNVGLDYCGPFFIKEKKVRNRSRLKVYVAVFVCFTTKAVHLEVVSDLTTETCIGALKRSFSRRGKPQNIYSDNATTFVGANNEFLSLRAYLTSQEYQNKMRYFSSEQYIHWHFIPPRSPHFGGLWEAAVKAFKNHLYKTVGDALFTFEQFSTLVIEIEAILNSRPLIPLSSDPNDFTALSPGHLLIGDSLLNLPELDISDTPTNKLSLWQHITKIKQHF